MTINFAGITRVQCATACNADRCVFSKAPYCAHPCKGGLHVGDKNNPELLAAQQQARAVLGVPTPAVAK